MLERDDFSSNRHSRPIFLFGHVLFGEPLHTFPDHALERRTVSFWEETPCAGHGERRVKSIRVGRMGRESHNSAEWMPWYGR